MRISRSGSTCAGREGHLEEPVPGAGRRTSPRWPGRPRTTGESVPRPGARSNSAAARSPWFGPEEVENDRGAGGDGPGKDGGWARRLAQARRGGREVVRLREVEGEEVLELFGGHVQPRHQGRVHCGRGARSGCLNRTSRGRRYRRISQVTAAGSGTWARMSPQTAFARAGATTGRITSRAVAARAGSPDATAASPACRTSAATRVSASAFCRRGAAKAAQGAVCEVGVVERPGDELRDGGGAGRDPGREGRVRGRGGRLFLRERRSARDRRWTRSNCRASVRPSSCQVVWSSSSAAVSPAASASTANAANGAVAGSSDFRPVAGLNATAPPS